MKRSSYTILVILILTILSSCHSQQPISKVQPQNNTTYQVEYLFEHDGCKVYRFYDKGEYIYFTSCNGNVTAIKSDSTNYRRQTITNFTP